MTPDELVGLLAEPSRLRLLAAVALGARTDDETAVASGLGAKDAAVARRRLAAAGLIVAEPGGWAVGYAALQQAARDRRPTRDPDADRVLSPFVEGRRLLSMPAQAGRRRAVLEHVTAITFDAGERYPETEVDARLTPWCEGGTVDHVALRRYLVEGGHLVRGGGIYALPSSQPPPRGAGERYVEALGLA